MTAQRVRRYALCAIAVPLIPALLWVGVVLVAPTSWAKGHVVAALEARTGRSVRLERLSVGWLGSVKLANLEIGSPRTTDDPWLKGANLRLNIHLVDLVRGEFRPRSLEIDGATLRVLRRGDGTLELADLILPEKEKSDRLPGDHGPNRLAYHVRGATLIVIDEPSQTRLHLQDVVADGTSEDRKVVISELRGVLNGGPFQFVGELDRRGASPRFMGHFHADDVVLDDGMSALRYAVPVLAGASLNLKGHLDTDIHVKGEGKSWDAVSKSLEGHGVIGINPIDLDGAPLIAELSKVTELSRQGRVASIHSDFVIKNQRITTDHFTLNVGRVPMTLAGWTGFDGHLDYRINLKALTDRIPDKARRLLGELKVDVNTLAIVSLRGTVNQMVVQVNGVSLDKGLFRESGLKREDRAKLRSLGRQFLEQITR